MRFNDSVTGIVLVVFAVAEITYAQTFPSLHGQSYGPNLFPTLIGAGFIACGVILIIRGILTKRKVAGSTWVSPGEWAGNKHAQVTVCLVLASLIAYILMSERIGFILLSLLILTLLLYRLGSSFLSAILIAAATTLVLQILFAKILLVPLPAGILQGLIW